MEHTPERVQARLTPEQKARIDALARGCYDGNLSMATRHIIVLGLRALDAATGQQQRHASCEAA